VLVARFNEVVTGETEHIFPFVIQTVDSISTGLSDVADLFFVRTLKRVGDPKAVAVIGQELEEIRSTAGWRLGGTESSQK
jgi:hypothetical protein